MKTAIDVKDRFYEILVNAGFNSELADGKISMDPDFRPAVEALLITSPGVDNGHDVVDTGDVAVNLIIKDEQGAMNSQRFRYLVKILIGIFENFKTHQSDFYQYERKTDGTQQTSQVQPANEYFHIRQVYTDGPHHDPKREGYSYFSVRFETWIEK
jgi:hypothetical protein